MQVSDPWRYVCPECGRRTVRSKTGPSDQREHPEDYDCKKCGAHFDEPLDLKKESCSQQVVADD